MKTVAELKKLAGQHQVWADDDWESALVKGHHDEQTAREIAAAELVYLTCRDDQSDAEEWSDATVRQVYARVVPCSPTCGEHAFHVIHTKGPGRGAFKATEVTRTWPRQRSERAS